MSILITYPLGEMNIIVQCFGFDSDFEDGEPKELNPDIYQPRKNQVYCCNRPGNESIPIETAEERADYIKHLRDSAERLKIMSHYLSKQADEIEEFGYPKTSCYYPE